MKKNYPRVSKIQLPFGGIAFFFTKLDSVSFKIRSDIVYDIKNYIDDNMGDIKIAHDSSLAHEFYSRIVVAKFLKKTQPLCEICFEVATQYNTNYRYGCNESPKTRYYCDFHAPKDAVDLKYADLLRMLKPYLRVK